MVTASRPGGTGSAEPVVSTDVDLAARTLAQGGLVAFATETVYGLGADARRPDAVRRIFAVKGRPTDHPLIVHLADPAWMARWATEVPDTAWRLAEACWPGPLTLVVPRGGDVPDAVTGGRSTVGLRVPAHPVALALLAAFGDGVAAPSANRFGRVSPTSAAHVAADLGGDVDLILDGGPCAVGVESTIVDCTGPRPEVLRSGGVSVDRVAEVLGAAPARWDGTGPARAPGMLAAHYAPRARVVVATEADLVPVLEDVRARRQPEAAPVALLAPASVVAAHAAGWPDVIVLDPPADAAAYARVLYARLRAVDLAGADVVVAVPPPADGGLGDAVGDRLRRAAASEA